jgi:hypothetical protein
MNIAQLRDTVTTLLGASPNLIGSYTLPDNTTIPALYVVGRQGVPPEWKVSGLEVTIEEFPRASPSPSLGKFKRRQEWVVVMVNYDTTSSNLFAAVERMMGRFPDAELFPSPESDVTYGQYRIVIPDVNMGYLAA